MILLVVGLLSPASSYAQQAFDLSSWWTNTHVMKRVEEGEGSVHRLIVEEEHVGWLVMTKVEEVFSVVAPAGGTRFFLVEGELRFYGSVPVSGLISVLPGREIHTVIPIAASADPERLQIVTNNFLVGFTGVGEMLVPSYPDDIGGGEECPDMCASEKIGDFKQCGVDFSVCSAAALAGYGIELAICLAIPPPAQELCLLAASANFLIQEGICAYELSGCENAADDKYDTCVANCCLIMAPPIQ